MTPNHRHVLLETSYALEHLLWSYRSHLDQEPTSPIAPDEVCLADYASRTASLVRGVIDDDAKRTGPRLAFRPPVFSDGKRLAAAIAARREALAAKRTVESSEPSEPGAGPSIDLPPVSGAVPTIDTADARESHPANRGFRSRPR